MARTKSVVLTMAEKNAILGDLKAQLKTAKQGVKEAVAAELTQKKVTNKATKEHNAMVTRFVKESNAVEAKLKKNTAVAQKAVTVVEAKLNALVPPTSSAVV